MLAFNTIFFLMMQMAGNTAAEQGEYIGQMREIVVTAPRYEYEDDAWSGLMDTVVVIAPRNEKNEAYDENIIANNKSRKTDPETEPFHTEPDNCYWDEPLGTHPKDGVYMHDQEIYE
ncbi:hypothetical protein AMJ74_00130 [candidate division WOR_3 bacterium SM1_77]|uniref:Uncharacterized protein n=1 Tax=candidate division WOR_3 bacterium SM1_77 TaxID=1703778 RepID=A0A0S8K1Y9_UNCW3|nr:MAG: hypothetical protein AMJ74_00130 [candidate division WOR_3 bacterium SM1_77]